MVMLNPPKLTRKMNDLDAMVPVSFLSRVEHLESMFSAPAVFIRTSSVSSLRTWKKPTAGIPPLPAEARAWLRKLDQPAGQNSQSQLPQPTVARWRGTGSAPTSYLQEAGAAGSKMSPCHAMAHLPLLQNRGPGRKGARMPHRNSSFWPPGGSWAGHWGQT